MTIPVNSPESGILIEVFAKAGETVEVGSDLFKIDLKAATDAPTTVEKTELKPAKVEAVAPEKASPKINTSTLSKPMITEAPQIQKEIKEAGSALSSARSEQRDKITRMRLRIAERMKEAQNSAASLTTFNEVDMSALMSLRQKYKELFAVPMKPI